MIEIERPKMQTRALRSSHRAGVPVAAGQEDLFAHAYGMHQHHGARGQSDGESIDAHRVLREYIHDLA